MGERMTTSVQNRLWARSWWIGLALLSIAVAAEAQETSKHAITFDDLPTFHRVAEASLSPDGKWVVYTVATPDMDANRNATNLWMAPVAGSDAIQLTRTGKDSSGKWSPDGKTIAFLSARSGESQIYLLPMEGGEAHPLTKLSTGADLVKWSPDGKTIAFTSSVYPDCVSRSAAAANNDDECNKKRNDEKEKNKVKANVADHLLAGRGRDGREGPRAPFFLKRGAGGGKGKNKGGGGEPLHSNAS